MTTFAHPFYLRRPEIGEAAPNNVLGVVPARYSIVLDTTKTGTAVGTTTVPLFVAPAGAKFYECVIDVVTAYDNLDTKITLGVPASTGILFAATSVNTTGRRAYAGSAAQIAFNASALAADVTVQAIVSIATSTVAAGSLVIHVVVG